jgi:magnesium transporter
MGNLREAYQSSLANRANEIMRVFTALTTIFMPLTFITGIYGMNFDYIPGMHESMGSVVLLVLMALIGFGMFYFFRKKDWL